MTAHDPDRRLDGRDRATVITADDFGRSPGVNAAVVHAFDEGWITEASIMPTGAAFAEAVELARAHGFADRIGVHLALDDGVARSAAIRSLPALCHADGRLSLAPRVRWRLDAEEERAIEAELEAQVAAVIDAGIAPTHVNSHHHVHTWWPIAGIVVRIAQRRRIRAVRPTRTCGPAASRAKRVYKPLLNARLRRGGVAAVRQFGSAPDAAIAAGPGPLEVMVHPDLDPAGNPVDATPGAAPLAATAARWRADGRLVSFAELAATRRPLPPRRLRVAMALYGDLTLDSRVLREADTLARAGHRVTVCSVAGHPPEGAPFLAIAASPDASDVLPDGSSPFLAAPARGRLARVAARLGWMIGYARNLRDWGRWAVDAAGEVDIWHAHDLPGLLAVGPYVVGPSFVRPAALRHRRPRLVYDSHEIFLETGSAVRLPQPIRRLLGLLEGGLARRAVALVTVNEGYAAVLRRRLRPRRIVLARNCPPIWTPPRGSSDPLRAASGVGREVPLLLYHGLFGRTRGVDDLVEAMLEPPLADAHVALLGFGPDAPALRERAAEARFGGRVHVLDAVPPGELLRWVAGADVDVIPLRRSTLNHWLCTPNKLWESIAAGVPVVVSDFPVMRRIVLDDPEGALGGVCREADPASIAASAAAILGLPTAERRALRARCAAAARRRWSWERESIDLLRLYAALGRSLTGFAPGEAPPEVPVEPAARPLARPPIAPPIDHPVDPSPGPAGPALAGRLARRL